MGGGLPPAVLVYGGGTHICYQINVDCLNRLIIKGLQKNLLCETDKIPCSHQITIK